MVDLLVGFAGVNGGGEPDVQLVHGEPRVPTAVRLQDHLVQKLVLRLRDTPETVCIKKHSSAKVISVYRGKDSKRTEWCLFT